MGKQKHGYHAVKRLNPRQWPAKMRRTYIGRVDELLSLPEIDNERHRGLIVQIAWYETLLGIVRQHIATTGPLDTDGKALDLLGEMRLMDSTLIKLYQCAGLTPFISSRMLEHKARGQSFTQWLADIEDADTQDAENDAKTALKDNHDRMDQNGADTASMANCESPGGEGASDG